MAPELTARHAGVLPLPALVLYARVPRRGGVKSRLVPWLDEDEALELHRALLFDSLGLLKRAARANGAEAIFAPSERWGTALSRSEPELTRALRGLRLLSQEGADLGERLLGTFGVILGGGAPAAVVIGSDSPTLPPRRIRDAFALLRGDAEVVLGPADDGGYCLVGARRLRPEAFAAIPWGGAAVLAATRAALHRSRVSYALLPAWYDVDRPADLNRLRGELAGAGRSAAAKTRDWIERLRPRPQM